MASGTSRPSEQPPAVNALFVGFVDEEPADEIAGLERFAGIARGVECGGSEALDVAGLRVRKPALPAFEVGEAQIDPSRCGVLLDVFVVQFDDRASRDDGRNADARTARDRQPSVAFAKNRRADANDRAR